MDIWKLPAIEFKVYTYIKNFEATHKGRTPANLHIADTLGTSEKTIQRTIKKLRDKSVL